MKKIIILIIIFLFPQNVFADENIEKKAREINKKIRCVVCQSQSIDDSDSILARDLKYWPGSTSLFVIVFVLP